MKNFKLATLVVASLAALNAPAFAVTLNPGGVVFTSGTTAAAQPELGGVVQNDNLIPFTVDPTPGTPFNNAGGNVQNRVAENSDGKLIFSHRIRDTYNLEGGTFSVLAYSVTGFEGFTTDVDFRTDGLGDKGFTSVSRSVDGDRMTFRYDDPLYVDAFNPPGRQETSLFPSILTDATDYDLSGTMTIFGEFTRTETDDGAFEPLGFGFQSVSFFEPVEENFYRIDLTGIAVPTEISEVPLPASSVLLLAGLAAMARLRKRS